MKRYILALDPGKMSGLATYDTKESEFISQQADFMTICDTLEQDVRAHRADVTVVCETFLITIRTAKNTQAPWSLEVQGVARYLARRYTGDDLVMSKQNAAKRFSTDERLRQVGWYYPGMTHANDAARHLLLYLVSHGWWNDSLTV